MKQELINFISGFLYARHETTLLSRLHEDIQKYDKIRERKDAKTKK